MHGLQIGIIAAEGERRRRGRFRDRNPGIIAQPVEAPVKAITGKVYLRQAESRYARVVRGSTLGYYPRGTLDFEASEYGSSTVCRIPSNMCVDGIEFTTKNCPILPWFKYVDYPSRKAIQLGSKNDLRRHTGIGKYSTSWGHPQIIRFAPTHQIGPADFDRARRVGLPFSYTFYKRMRHPYNRSYMYMSLILTLVEGSTEQEATYRLWDRALCIPRFFAQGPNDVWPRGRLETLLKTWADSTKNMDYLRRRTMQYGVRRSSHSSIGYSSYSSSQAIGYYLKWPSHSFYSPGGNAIMSIDMHDALPNHHICIGY